MTNKTVKHYNTCKECGNEFRVPAADSTEEICYRCKAKVAVGVAKEKLLQFIGAKITYIEPAYHGAYTTDDEIEFVDIQLDDGRRVRFSVAGIADDPYIEWNLRHQS